jgi:UDP-N-acetyl-D-mannosaminuronic acid dehydrogenase
MKSRTYDICIVGGLGRVGLPLGIAFANSELKVVLYDINRTAMNVVSMGKMPFLESGAEEILRKVLGKNLFLSYDRHTISQSYFIIIVIGTPTDEHLNPEIALFKQLLNEIIEFIHDDQHIILRSTVFPGTTEKVREYLRSKGKQTKVSFCPERIAEGKAIEELKQLPQIVSSFDEASLSEARDLFSHLTQDIIILSPAEAELAKLFINAWRYIQFAISNQFYQLAAQQGLDFYKIYNAIIFKYPRAQNFPPAGFTAGPCLLKDTMQLTAFSGNTFFLGHAAMLVNEGLPNFILQKLKERFLLKDKVVGILGMAFKADSDDKRESLSYRLKKIFEIEAKKILCSDVYLHEEGFVSAERLIQESDIIILATPHKEYAKLVPDQNRMVVDIWNFYGKGDLFKRELMG